MPSTLSPPRKWVRLVSGRRVWQLRPHLEYGARGEWNFGLFESEAAALQVRRKLLADHSVGTIAFPDENGIRLAYCSIHEDKLSELVDAFRSAARATR